MEVYKATTKSGESCHFGHYQSAKDWAGEGGIVETIQLKGARTAPVRAVGDVAALESELARVRDELRALLDEIPHARDAARYAAWRDYMLSNDERDELDLPDAVWMAGDSEEFDDAVDQWRAERENMKSRIPRAGGES